MVVFAVFVGIILFATLFMKKDSLHPSQLYITVVMYCTIALIGLYSLVVSSLSLPADIRDRTLHTVVTKPVRKVEFVWAACSVLLWWARCSWRRWAC